MSSVGLRPRAAATGRAAQKMRRSPRTDRRDERSVLDSGPRKTSPVTPFDIRGEQQNGRAAEPTKHGGHAWLPLFFASRGRVSTALSRLFRREDLW